MSSEESMDLESFEFTEKDVFHYILGALIVMPDFKLYTQEDNISWAQYISTGYETEIVEMMMKNCATNDIEQMKIDTTNFINRRLSDYSYRN
jgi:hypothetical protein